MTRAFVMMVWLWLLASQVKAQSTEFPSCATIESQLPGAWHSPDWSEMFSSRHTYIYTEDGDHMVLGSWRCISSGVIGITLFGEERTYRVRFPNRRMVTFTSLYTDYTYTALRHR